MNELSEDSKIFINRAMMINFARSSLLTMKMLHGSNSVTDWHLPYYYLAHTFLELCPKILVATRLELEGQDLGSIKAELKKLGHNLGNIYSCDLIKKQSCYVEIKNVETKETDDVYRYEFYVLNEEQAIYVYDPESLKYGLTSKKVNLGFVAYQFDHLLQLCNRVWDMTRAGLNEIKRGDQ